MGAAKERLFGMAFVTHPPLCMSECLCWPYHGHWPDIVQRMKGMSTTMEENGLAIFWAKTKAKAKAFG